MSGVPYHTTRLLIVLFFAYATASAQTGRIDSLKSEVNRSAGKDRLDHLIALCKEGSSLTPDTLLNYAIAARTLADQQKDPVKGTLAEYFIASTLLTKGLPDSSLKIADRELKTLQYLGGSSEAYVYFSLLKARILNSYNRPKEGLDIYFPLLSIAEKHDDTVTQISAINGIVSAYVAIGDNRKALDWGQRSVHLWPHAWSLTIARAISITLGNIGLCYAHAYETDSAKADLDSANRYTSRAIDMDRQYEFLGGLAYNLSIMGAIYGFGAEPEKGEVVFKESLLIYRQIGNIYYTINAMASLADFYHSTRQPEKGIAICKEGIALSGHLKPNFFLYENLAQNYKLLGNYKEYGETVSRLAALKDSMYKVNTAEAMSDLQTKYEVQTKENIIIRQKLDLTRKNNLLYGSLGLFFLLLISGSILLVARKRNQAIKIQQLQVEEKRKTLRAVLQAEENERVRIAADLHDGVAQKMVVAKMNLQTFETYFPAFNADQRRVFDNASSLVEESCTEVRDLSHSMMPQAFFRSGLTEAVKNLLNKIGDKRLLVKFDAVGSLDHVPDNTQIMIYRIMQECIQNVLKHAKATTLDIAIIAENEELDITVEDNGVGFDKDYNTDGVGLANIRSRVAFLNGQLDISSRPGEGTLMAFFIPMKDDKSLKFKP